MFAWGNLGSTYNYVVGLYTNAGIFVSGYASPQWTTTSPHINYNDDEWHHLVVTLGSGTHKIYVDGSEIDSRSATFDTGGGGTVKNAVIGNYGPSGSEDWTGELDDMAIWNRVITSGEVTNLWNSGDGALANTISTTGLLAYYNFDSVAGDKCVNQAYIDKSKASITDVPVGTRYEETDTKKIFRRKASLTSEDDLTTNKGWTSNSGDWAHSTANDSVDLSVIRITLTSQEIYMDLQDSDYLNGSNLSDSSWVIRLGKLRHNSFSTGGNVQLNITISKLVQDSGTNQYSINLQPNLYDHSSALFWRLRANSNTNNETNSTASVNFNQSLVKPTLSYSYLWELKRDGNDFSATAYAESDTSYASPLETVTVTASGITALRYILITSDSEQAGNAGWTADMDCFIGGIKIYNGTTSADDSWVEKGTA